MHDVQSSSCYNNYLRHHHPLSACYSNLLEQDTRSCAKQAVWMEQLVPKEYSPYRGSVFGSLFSLSFWSGRGKSYFGRHPRFIFQRGPRNLHVFESEWTWMLLLLGPDLSPPLSLLCPILTQRDRRLIPILRWELP